MSATATEHRVGLRFRRSQARTLRNLADRMAARDLADDAGLFYLAAEAAGNGEPLIVVCTEPLEAVVMAEGFVRFGVARPAIEELSGTG